MIRSWDIFSADQIDVGSADHHTVMDLIDACRGPRDEEILRLRLGGCTQSDIADITGSSQQTVSRRLGRLLDWIGLDSLSQRLRDRSHIDVAEAEVKATADGLTISRSWRIGSHDRRARPHGRLTRECWCARKAAA